MKFSLSSLALISDILATVKSLQKCLSIAVYFWSEIYQTSKLHYWIQAIYSVTKALHNFVLNQFNCINKTFASVFTINFTSYNQNLTFFKAFKTSFYNIIYSFYSRSKSTLKS